MIPGINIPWKNWCQACIHGLNELIRILQFNHEITKYFNALDNLYAFNPFALIGMKENKIYNIENLQNDETILKYHRFVILSLLSFMHIKVVDSIIEQFSNHC